MRRDNIPKKITQRSVFEHSLISQSQSSLPLSVSACVAMANSIMASSKPLISLSSSTQPTRVNLPKSIKLPQIPKPISSLRSKALSFSSATVKSLALIAALAPPSMAEAMEKAQLFDFNLTLPIIVVEFLFLMFALDKVYYSPLGNFMDKRDGEIKEKLASVKDTSAEVKALDEQAAAVMRAARAEIAAALNKMKKETQVEVEEQLAVGRKKVEAELQEALASLEKQKEETIKALDSQIAALSEDIVKKVLPS